MQNTNNNTENAIAGENCDQKAIALANHLGIELDEVTPERYSHYDMAVYLADGGEYAIGTDDESDNAACEYIAEFVWAFRPQFLANFTGLPQEMFAALQDKCEGANDAFVKCVERTEGGMERFAICAISADGRGHFLASYNGDEIELGNGLFAYRIN